MGILYTEEEKLLCPQGDLCYLLNMQIMNLEENRYQRENTGSDSGWDGAVGWQVVSVLFGVKMQNILSLKNLRLIKLLKSHQKTASVHSKSLVALWEGSVWCFPRHGFVRTMYLTPASCKRLVPCWWYSGLSCSHDFFTVYSPGWNALCPALQHLS